MQCPVFEFCPGKPREFKIGELLFIGVGWCKNISNHPLIYTNWEKTGMQNIMRFGVSLFLAVHMRADGPGYCPPPIKAGLKIATRELK
jgi:hypothetical protein